MSAGKRMQKLHFQRREAIDDGYGNPQSGEFVTVFTEAAELVLLKGSEPVIGARLTGVQPYTIRIPGSANARSIDTAWRAVDARDPMRIFSITTVGNPDQANRQIEIMATQGVAA